MGRRSKSKRDLAGLAVTGAVVTAAERAGQLAGRAREGAGELVVAAGPLKERVVEGAGELVERSGPFRDRVVEGAGELVVVAAPVVGSAVETVSGVLDEALERGEAAWVALRGEQVAPSRRWPWAVAAAVAGAAAGGAAAVLLRRIAPADAPGAQEPHELRAVVDTADAPRPPTSRETTSQVPPAAAAAGTGSTVAPPLHEGDSPNGSPRPAPPVSSPTFEL